MSREDLFELLTVCIASLILLSGLAALLVLVPKETADTPRVDLMVMPRDRPLLSSQEKAWAREDGVAGFWYDGHYYVIAGLDPVYWR